LRTISGGIICGFAVLFVELTQLRLLGYHNTAKSRTGHSICFFVLLNIYAISAKTTLHYGYRLILNPPFVKTVILAIPLVIFCCHHLSSECGQKYAKKIKYKK